MSFPDHVGGIVGSVRIKHYSRHLACRKNLDTGFRLTSKDGRLHSWKSACRRRMPDHFLANISDISNLDSSYMATPKLRKRLQVQTPNPKHEPYRSQRPRPKQGPKKASRIAPSNLAPFWLLRQVSQPSTQRQTQIRATHWKVYCKALFQLWPKLLT